MKYIVVLFCLLSSLSYGQKARKQAVSASQPISQPNEVSTMSDADQILQYILTDFSVQLSESGNKPSTVVMLDGYSQLAGKRIAISNINFVAGGKPEILNNNGVSIAFWRMDISETRAHIEFYYTDSKGQTTHHEYLLTKENAVWRK